MLDKKENIIMACEYLSHGRDWERKIIDLNLANLALYQHCSTVNKNQIQFISLQGLKTL